MFEQKILLLKRTRTKTGLFLKVLLNVTSRVSMGDDTGLQLYKLSADTEEGSRLQVSFTEKAPFKVKDCRSSSGGRRKQMEF